MLWIPRCSHRWMASIWFTLYSLQNASLLSMLREESTGRSISLLIYVDCYMYSFSSPSFLWSWEYQGKNRQERKRKKSLLPPLPPRLKHNHNSPHPGSSSWSVPSTVYQIGRLRFPPKCTPACSVLLSLGTSWARDSDPLPFRPRIHTWDWIRSSPCSSMAPWLSLA